MSKQATGKRGQALVEFSLVIIPVLILIMGVMQLAHIAVNTLLVNHAAFTVARIGILPGTEKKLRNAAEGALPFTDKGNIILRVLSTKTDPELKIQLEYRMPLIFPIVNMVIAQLKNLPDGRLPIVAEYRLPKEAFI